MYLKDLLRKDALSINPSEPMTQASYPGLDSTVAQNKRSESSSSSCICAVRAAASLVCNTVY